MQQGYAKLSGVTEIVTIADLVEASLRMTAATFACRGVALVREFDEVPLITVDKNRVVQILVNLVKNAKHACDDSLRTDKRVTVRISQSPVGVSVVVTDNGVGILPENMTRIFSHGFTTRKNGHGFGLHSGALAAQELGGSLTVASDGPGCGATFTLQLPLTPTKGRHDQAR
jgi:signal transduction histidine kinase